MSLHADLKAGSTLEFPKVIRQIHTSSDSLHEEALVCQTTWRELNPHWQLELATQANVRDVFTEFLPEYVEIFDALPLGVMKADMWRYAAIYVHGGMYGHRHLLPCAD